MGACLDYMIRKFGFPIETREQADVVLAAGVVQQVLQNNPNRIGWTIINEGAGVANLAFPGAAPTATHGIRFAAAGGWRSTIVELDGELPTNALYGFSAAGTTLYIQETVAL